MNIHSHQLFFEIYENSALLCVVCPASKSKRLAETGQPASGVIVSLFATHKIQPNAVMQINLGSCAFNPPSTLLQTVLVSQSPPDQRFLLFLPLPPSLYIIFSHVP